jgi:hypothetical protein
MTRASESACSPPSCGTSPPDASCAGSTCAASRPGRRPDPLELWRTSLRRPPAMLGTPTLISTVVAVTGLSLLTIAVTGLSLLTICQAHRHCPTGPTISSTRPRRRRTECCGKGKTCCSPWAGTYRADCGRCRPLPGYSHRERGRWVGHPSPPATHLLHGSVSPRPAGAHSRTHQRQAGNQFTPAADDRRAVEFLRRPHPRRPSRVWAQGGSVEDRGGDPSSSGAGVWHEDWDAPEAV